MDVRSLSDTDLKASVIFGDLVGKVDLLSFAQKLPQLRSVVHAQVIAHEVPVEAVPSPILSVQQQIRGWRQMSRRHGSLETQREALGGGMCKPTGRFFSHLLPSSGHTSCGPRTSSRPSGWSWRSRQTCDPSSPPAGRAAGTEWGDSGRLKHSWTI